MENSQKLEFIGSWIDLVQPQDILTFGPYGVSGHPDHVTISRTVTQAVDQFYPTGWLLYIAPSEATVLECGVSFNKANRDKPLFTVDISDYKIEKVRVIQCHASQNPALKGKPEEEVDKVPCHEYFTIARSGKNPDGSADWFEIVKDSAQYHIKS